jgi:hypothetical protein
MNWRDASTQVEGRAFVFDYLDHRQLEMPGDDHPGARFTDPQVRVWDGKEAMTGNVVAEAYLSETDPDLIISAWATTLEANRILADGIAVWADQHGCTSHMVRAD